LSLNAFAGNESIFKRLDSAIWYSVDMFPRVHTHMCIYIYIRKLLFEHNRRHAWKFQTKINKNPGGVNRYLIKPYSSGLYLRGVFSTAAARVFKIHDKRKKIGCSSRPPEHNKQPRGHLTPKNDYHTTGTRVNLVRLTAIRFAHADVLHFGI